VCYNKITQNKNLNFLMGRKRKYHKHSQDAWYQKFDWSLDPQTKREIFSVAFIALGMILIFSIFGFAGVIGQKSFAIMSDLFGLGAFVVPFAFLALGYFLWKARELNIKATTIIGIVALFALVPSLFAHSGGIIGSGIYQIFVNLFGAVLAIILNICLTIIFLLLSTNLSWRQLREWSASDESKEPTTNESSVSVFETVRDHFRRKPKEPNEAPAQASVFASPRTRDRDWQFPPLDLLSASPTRATAGNITRNVEIIQKTLKDFNVNVTMGDVNIGPTVTQYTLKPHEGVKLNQIVARANDLALTLASHPIRIEAPIPGKAAVGVEVPNKVPATVTLREVLESETFKKNKTGLILGLGRDVSGKPLAVDLSKMPHLLIAGATGSGKSNFINAIVLTLLFQNSPTDIRMILVDPKRVEFTMYNGIPHLMTPVVTEVKKTINTLKWAVAEMEKRFKLFAETHKRNITEYNQNPTAGHMPYIVIVIDELADLMTQAANEVEGAIVRLSQMARATGIHLIIATQRPSVDVITGLIKANIPTRIAFAVASQIDSRTILDNSGAEKLLGNGDMLFQSADFGKPRRVQSPLILDKEIKAVSNFLKREGEATYDESISEYKTTGRSGMPTSEEDIDDDLYEETKDIIIAAGKASASLLQRRLRIGYARAARLLDILESQGIIGPQEGSKPREVLTKSLDIMPGNEPHQEREREFRNKH